MIYSRKAKDRGHLNYGWLDTKHTFSFGSYFDPKHMGFGILRVINDDRIAPSSGFEAHPHKDMEIISFVKEGALEHKDSLGESGVLRPGEIQVISAGSGIFHSEFNHLKDASTSFYQIWIEPNRKGGPPSYQQLSYAERIVPNALIELASGKGGEGSATLQADASLSYGRWEERKEIDIALSPTRKYWIQVVDGSFKWQDTVYKSGDGVGIDGADAFNATTLEESSFLLFDLP